ncbi:ArsR family transcriptional regulator [Cryobacterium sp. TMT1-62]|uniref:helix-turn-helix transcriptional regulator n=1 Tax=unclassified Cryobacterium TaxID=2649013 RepID=UPI00106C8224|nr:MULTISPECIES: helix-turn-helix domain-containing protein [unclassified Cryobacterium]TFB59440.1 ArsR family transcriptional regulator [Cryobacterium sp. Hz7]TFC54408.1 ArsR family transcriptional regulator [Cryobacterium sp. TMT2-17-1]TFD34389.1 ArsR family transcriptional regulator [Cryobacterium sp. TMT1-62]
MTPSSPSSSYRTLASFSRIQLLYFLQQRGTMTVGDLAEATGLHHNTAREHLQRLIGDGFVTCHPENKDSKGRPRMLYSAAAGPNHVDGSIRAAKAEAADRHGDQVRRMLRVEAVIHSPLQRQLDALDDHLDESGFDARLEIDGADGNRVHLHECPYSEMVKAHPEVCRVHFGLLKTLLERTEGPLSADALHPLVELNTCTLDLHRSDADPGVETGAAPTAPERLKPAIIYHGVSGL